MSFIHPIQSAVFTKDGSHIFIVVKNMISAFTYKDSSYELVGQWVDSYDRTNIIKEKITKEQERQIAENVKKSKNNEGDAVIIKKDAKIPQPGSGAPPIFSHIRNVALFDNDTKLIACADSDKSVIVFNINFKNSDNCFELIKRQPFPKRPNGIAVTKDQKNIIMADKFGDVFSMDIESEPISKINEESEPILGHVSMLTDVLCKEDRSGRQYIITADRDEHIKISHYPQTFIVDKWLFGHKEFVSTLDAPSWKNNWLFSAGGDDSIFLWDWESGKLVSTFNYTKFVKPFLNDKHLAPSRFQNEDNNVVEYAVAKIVSASTGAQAAFFIEATNVLFIISVDVDTGKMKLKEKIEFPCNIISLSKCDNKFIVTLDNSNLEGDHDLVKVLTIDRERDQFIIDRTQSSALDNAIKNWSQSVPEIIVNSSDVFPLYGISALRKHGEHYS